MAKKWHLTHTKENKLHQSRVFCAAVKKNPTRQTIVHQVGLFVPCSKGRK